jgi:hypothetical protein
MRTVATWRCVMSRGLESAWLDLEDGRWWRTATLSQVSIVLSTVTWHDHP